MLRGLAGPVLIVVLIISGVIAASRWIPSFRRDPEGAAAADDVRPIVINPEFYLNLDCRYCGYVNDSEQAKKTGNCARCGRTLELLWREKGSRRKQRDSKP